MIISSRTCAILSREAEAMMRPSRRGLARLQQSRRNMTDLLGFLGITASLRNKSAASTSMMCVGASIVNLRFNSLA
jgi:hypothetical protein